LDIVTIVMRCGKNFVCLIEGEIFTGSQPQRSFDSDLIVSVQ